MAEAKRGRPRKTEVLDEEPVFNPAPQIEKEEFSEEAIEKVLAEEKKAMEIEKEEIVEKEFAEEVIEKETRVPSSACSDCKYHYPSNVCKSCIENVRNK